MTPQLIPLSELAPPVGEGLAAEQYIAEWLDLMDATEELLLAGLRRHLGPQGDVASAYRRWYSDQMAAHDQTVCTMMQELHRREGQHGR